MITTTVRSVMLTVLLLTFLLRHGAQSSDLGDESSSGSGVLDLPWRDELCCDSSPARRSVEGGRANSPGTNSSEFHLPRPRRCNFRSRADESHPHGPSSGTCWGILCTMERNWGNLTCDLQPVSGPSTTLGTRFIAVSLQQILSQKVETDNPVICEAEDSFTCSLALHPSRGSVAMVTISVSDTAAPPVLLKVPKTPVKPAPPVNLSHFQTIEPQLILNWENPSDLDGGAVRYEVRYANSPQPAWKVVSVPLGESKLSLDLESELNYSVQVRCSGRDEPPLWSDWSQPHHIYLYKVSYIPEKVVARPGDNVTVYCVFNDHSVNASSAVWLMNFHHLLPRSRYRPVNQWVSQVTVQPSENRMYDQLRCTQEWTHPYTQIYVEGASIDIKCETNGDIDTMVCTWISMQWTKPTFQSKWSDLECEEMEEREKAGEEVGEMGPSCNPLKGKKCSIQPLRMNCYRLWLELPSRLGLIRSKPVYLTPIDYVKPYPPTHVEAVSQSGGVLAVSWEPPPLPTEGVQCRLRFHPQTSNRALVEWREQSPVRVHRAEVEVPDMCWKYNVQVSCMHTRNNGYWSEWSETVQSTPGNSRAPVRGPDFWRIHQEHSHGNQTNVTLLFEDLPLSEDSYCVEGFVVQHQTSDGSVSRQRIARVSSYSFEWNQESQSITVEAFNSLGSSADNMKMTLDRRPKRGCVRWFHASVINSSCVCVSWGLWENSSAPLSMVVQWSPQRLRASDGDSRPRGNTWSRLPYTDQPVYLRGEFFGSDSYSFYLYPVYPDGEGEPVYTLATRGDPAVYVMMTIVALLSITLFVTLLLSQNQMKRLVWKDIPNPRKCSWAKGLDFKKVETFDHLFCPPEGLPAWPLLLPSERISKVLIVDTNTRTTALLQHPLASLTSDPSPPSPPSSDSDLKVESFPQSGASVSITLEDFSASDRLQAFTSSADLQPGSVVSSAQSAVTYATVLPPDLKKDDLHLHEKEISGGSSSSSDEGNFSANNSDISGSFPGGLWELDDPRRSRSFNSVEEFSEQEDEAEVREKEEEEEEEMRLYYLGMDYPAEDERSKEVEERKSDLLLRDVICSPVESHPLLGHEDASEPQAPSPSNFSSLYQPQFRTAPHTRQQDRKPQL